jgi:diguanylate cyclase (GGDEF)-like protein
MRETRLQEAETATSNLARSLAQHADDTIKQADTVLVGLVERVEVGGMSFASLDRLHKLLVARAAELPQLHGLFIFDENGYYTVDSQQTGAKAFNNSDREYFAFHRSHPDRGPHIGPPVRSRTTGAWIITVTRRINYADGSFAGVALATINMDYFRKFHSSFDIGRDGAIFLALNNGTLLVRRPFSDAVIGESIAGGMLFRDYLSKTPVGTAMMKSVVDGVERLYGYHRLERYPLVLAVALSKDEILADWRREAYLHSIGIMILVLALGLLGYRLVRQIGLRVHAEKELLRAQDVLQTLNQNLEELALQDGLTGLANRRQFDIALKNEFRRAVRDASPLALVMIDVDCFKQYNDIYGHPEGDECLRRIGQVVKAGQNRPGDLSARYGGEELAVLLPNTDMAGAVAVAEKIRRAIHDLKIEHSGNRDGLVTISAGVDAFVPGKGNTSLELIEAADKALYAAKSGGRDRVCSHMESKLA